MAIYEVVLDSVYYGQQCINRWNFVSSGTSAAALISFLLVKAMGFIESAGNYPTGTYFDAQRRIQHEQVKYAQVVCKNIKDPTDFYALPFITPITGSHTQGEATAPFIAWGIRSNQVRLDIGRGYKRFVGVGEEDVAAGGTLIGTSRQLLVEMCTVYNAPLTINDEGNTVSFTQAIIQKEKYTVPNSTPPRQAYRYYETEAAQLAHSAQGISWQPYDQIRTQTSRQYKKGS